MYRELSPIFLVLTSLITLLASCTKLPAQIEDNAGVKMAMVPGGEFEMRVFDEMKDETSVHSVHVDDFYIDVYEVTNQRYTACVIEGACDQPVDTTEYADDDYSDHPVIFVTWDMANSYCKWRNARLPTKAEWEKAAADELEEIEYFWGDVSPTCQVGSRLGAGFEGSSQYDPGTITVGSSPANVHGLYEMTGGMWEWVQDKHALDIYTSSPDDISFIRMFRWSGYGPLYNRYLCSFRCARSP